MAGLIWRDFTIMSLEDLVRAGPEVDMAVGVGRAVVENVAGTAPALLAKPAVKPHLFPFLEDFGLFYGQVGPHGKIGSRQIERFLYSPSRSP